MRHTPLVNCALYQAGWFACVLGAAWHHPVAAAIFGAAGGALAFLAGARLGAVVFGPPLAVVVSRLALTWGAALLVLSLVVTRLAAADEAQAPTYRW